MHYHHCCYLKIPRPIPILLKRDLLCLYQKLLKQPLRSVS